MSHFPHIVPQMANLCIGLGDFCIGRVSNVFLGHVSKAVRMVPILGAVFLVALAQAGADDDAG